MAVQVQHKAKAKAKVQPKMKMKTEKRYLFFPRIPIEGAEGFYLTYVPPSSSSSSSSLSSLSGSSLIDSSIAIMDKEHPSAANQAFRMPEYAGCGYMALSRDLNIILVHNLSLGRVEFMDKRLLPQGKSEMTNSKGHTIIAKKWTWMKHPENRSGRFVDSNLSMIYSRRTDGILSGDNQLRCGSLPNENVFSTWWTQEPVVCEEVDEKEARTKDPELVYEIKDEEVDEEKKQGVEGKEEKVDHSKKLEPKDEVKEKCENQENDDEDETTEDERGNDKDENKDDEDTNVRNDEDE